MEFSDANKTLRATHAAFGTSRFTYFGRNSSFLASLGYLRTDIRRLVLCGSGPIEPLEVAACPCFRDSEIIAVDNDPEVYQLIAGALRTGELDVARLATTCRSADSENPYLSNPNRLTSQLVELRHRGLNAGLHEAGGMATVELNHRHIASRLRVRHLDLRTALPTEIRDAQLVFEGFMLVNWAKTASDAAETSHFLRTLRGTLSPRAWFASANSVTSYLPYYQYSRPFLRQLLEADFLPFAGVLARWSVNTDGQVTSYFGTVNACTNSVDAAEQRLGQQYEIHATRALTDLGVRYCSEEIDASFLPGFVEAGNVVAFRRLDRSRFAVLKADWSELSNKILRNRRSYNLSLDAY